MFNHLSFIIGSYLLGPHDLLLINPLVWDGALQGLGPQDLLVISLHIISFHFVLFHFVSSGPIRVQLC